nr:CHASE3 domain-containing protein [Erythrobacter sp. LQ02-29]
MPETFVKREVRDASAGWPVVGLLLGIGFFVISAIASYSNVLDMRDNETRIRNTHEVLTTLDDLMIAMLDTETGQRGYVLTGHDQYLEPYHAGVAAAREELSALAALTRNSAVQRDNLDRLRNTVATKFRFSELAIRTRREGGIEAAIALTDSDRGKIAMDAIRQQMAQMTREETGEREKRIAELAAA